MNQKLPRGRPKGKKNKPKTVFEQAGYKITKVPSYMKDQIESAITTKSFITKPVGKGKIPIEYQHVIDTFFRSNKTNEYMYYSQKSEYDDILIHTGISCGDFTMSSKVLRDWEKQFLSDVNKVSD